MTVHRHEFSVIWMCKVLGCGAVGITPGGTARNWYPAPDLLHHSNHGSQYTAEAYPTLLEKAHCQVSMSHTGDCYDNAAMESFLPPL